MRKETTVIKRFEDLLATKKQFENKQISLLVQFNSIITISNQQGMLLIEYIEVYDKLIATKKLLHLAGCFNTQGIYFTNIKRYQRNFNQLLSHLLLMPTKNE